MKALSVTIWAEGLKLRKSRVFWLSFVFFMFVSFMMGLIMFVQQHPEISEKLGIIGTKANMLKFGEPNWQNYFVLLSQGIAGIGLVGFGFITAWIYGREYTENTIKDLLALPIPRWVIVISKMIMVVLWCVLLAFVFFASGIFFGRLYGIPGWSTEILKQFAHTFFMISLLSIMLCTPVAFFASYSKGFLLPMGIVILTMIMANFTGLVGLGQYFPWSIPGMLSAPQGNLYTVSYVILGLTNLLGLFATMAWWQYADHK